MNIFEVNNIKLSVMEDNEFMAKHGTPRGIPSALLSLSKTPEYDGVVRVTKAFFRLSEESQKAVLLHEAGHIACGHLNNLPEDFDGLVVNPDFEAEADVWADNILGEGAFDKFIEECRQVVIAKLGEHATPDLIEKINEECRVRTANRKAWIAKNR